MLAVALVTNARVPCNGFKVEVNNNLSENLRIREINFIGGDFGSGGIDMFSKIESHQKRTFIVNNTSKEGSMMGQVILETISFPKKEIILKFKLENKLFCRYDDQSGDSSGGYAINSDKSLGDQVTYTIG